MVFILYSINSFGQLLQPKKFTVNAYTFFGSFSTELKPMCESFEISVSRQFINIGESFDLKVESSNYDAESKSTTFLVKDPKNQIGAVMLGISRRGSNYLQINFLDDKGDVSKNGIIFQYWDYVDDFVLWKLNRDSKSIDIK
jgi:hypothetical protein